MNKTRSSKKVNRSRKNKNYNSFDREVVIKFLSLLNTVKIYHWKTHSYSTHKATDSLQDKLNANIDRFVEVLLGKIGNRINFNNINSIPFQNINSTEEMKKEINKFKSYLVNLDNNKFMSLMSNSDLFTIRDEILADLNQFLYLLTFNH